VTRPVPTGLAVTVGALALGLLAGCTSAPTVTSGPTLTSSPEPSPSASPSPSPSPSPTPTLTVTSSATPAPTWWSPLTGEPGESAKPVLIVKLDNTAYAQPHAGLSKADVVYIEEVEYGITRLAAVFSDHIPRRIGPVRSARITDIDLLAQYVRPAFAYSGAQRKMFPYLDGADFYDVSPRRGGEGYSRDYNRRSPYNYYVDGRTSLKRAPKATVARDMGFTFDEEVPAGGLVAKKADMAWGYSSAGFDYRPKLGQYAVRLNGQPAKAEETGKDQLASTVVIQYVKQEPSQFFDKGGGNTPHADTIGKGKAVVLRDGLAWDVTWSRPTAEDGTTFTRADGTQMAFKPGQLWIVLLDKKRKATIKPLTEPTTSPTTSASTSASASASATGSQDAQ
jgi:hypothetical protein